MMNVFTDGSWSSVKNAYSYGIVFVEHGEVVHTIHGVARNPKACKTQSVAGELKAAIEAVRYCYKNGITKFNLHHDYEGVAAWPIGLWKTKNEVTQGYVDYMRKFDDVLDISFVKVQAHSNNKFNDMADELAKKALADYKGD